MIDFSPLEHKNLPKWSWNDFEPFYRELTKAPKYNAGEFLAQWTILSEAMDESFSRLHVATTVNTTDEQARARYHAFLEDVFPKAEEQEQALKKKLLEFGQIPTGFELPLERIKQEIALFRGENLPLFVQERKLESEYDEIIGSQSVVWEEKELTVPQLRPFFQDVRRETRESAWRTAINRQLEDREAINELWRKFLELRLTIARNAGFEDYRSFRWKQLMRFDYTPEDCKRFHDSIEKVVVPCAARLCQRRRESLGLRTLRPWDMDVDPLGREPLKPFSDVAELTSRCAAIFSSIDRQLGAYFQAMLKQGLLDLDNRKNKAPGGYCTDFPASRTPFIFMNAVGLHDDVQTLFHESGHAFHSFERVGLPYYHQRHTPMEFAEVASMSMELIAGEFLKFDKGGFYTEEEAYRARDEHLEKGILFWPYMAVVDAFQHWVYEYPEEAINPTNCDRQWARLWDRFMNWMDWSGLEEELSTGWQRKLHIHTVPFYYVEYGLAQLGAVQVWQQWQMDSVKAMESYRRALSLGGTVSLPMLYKTAGASLTFEESALFASVAHMESKLEYKLTPSV